MITLETLSAYAHDPYTYAEMYTPDVLYWIHLDRKDARRKGDKNAARREVLQGVKGREAAFGLYFRQTRQQE